MRRALLGGCLVAAICVASVFGQQPDDFGKKGGKGGGRGGKGKAMPAFRELNPPARWDYAVRMHADVMEMGGGDLQRGLNHMGELGWELVTVDGIFGQGHGHAYFKRPRTGRPLPEGEEGEQARRNINSTLQVLSNLPGLTPAEVERNHLAAGRRSCAAAITSAASRTVPGHGRGSRYEHAHAKRDDRDHSLEE